MIKNKIILIMAILVVNIASTTFAAQPTAEPVLKVMPQELRDAIQSKDISKIDAWLALHPEDVNSEYNYSTPLELAIYDKNPDLVEYFIEKGANVNVNRSYGSPLTEAIGVRERLDHKDYEALRLLSNRGITDDFIKQEQDRFRLESGDMLTIIKLLINNGADVNYKFPLSRKFPLYNADYELTKLLLEAGANPDQVANWASGPMNALDAAKESREEIIENLEKYRDLDTSFGEHMRKKIQNNLNKLDEKIKLLTDYHQARRENIILQRGLAQKPETGVRSLFMEYITGKPSAKQVYEQSVAINAIKNGLKEKNLEPLVNFINNNPKSINAQDEAGNSLLLSIKAQYIPAIQIILERLKSVDQAENSVNTRLIRALDHKNTYGDNALDIAHGLKNKEIIELLSPYYNFPVAAPEQTEIEQGD